MTVPMRRLRRRWPLLAGSAALAAVWGAADGLGGHAAAGALGAALILGFGLVLWLSGRECAVAARGEGDERIEAIQAESARITLFLATLVAIAGALVELAHGHYGPYGVMCSTIGALVLVTPQVLRRFR